MAGEAFCAYSVFSNENKIIVWKVAVPLWARKDYIFVKLKPMMYVCSEVCSRSI